MTEKDKKIIEDAEKEGIPIFVFTAKDVVSSTTLAYYWNRCISAGCKPEHTKAILDRVNEFKEWQRNNQNKVKLPD